MNNHQGNKATARVYFAKGRWCVGYFGYVAAGNGRYVYGYIKEAKCVSKEEAERLATAQNQS
jgi:hypothetical protein